MQSAIKERQSSYADINDQDLDDSQSDIRQIFCGLEHGLIQENQNATPASTSDQFYDEIPTEMEPSMLPHAQRIKTKQKVDLKNQKS